MHFRPPECLFNCFKHLCFSAPHMVVQIILCTLVSLLSGTTMLFAMVCMSLLLQKFELLALVQVYVT